MLRGRAEWTSAAEAAEQGLKILGSSEELAYAAGLSRSQLAKDLYQQAQYGRAEQEANKAEVHLKAALLDLDEVENGKYILHNRIHRAIVVNYERLNQR